MTQNPYNFIKLQKHVHKDSEPFWNTTWYSAETADGKKHLTADTESGYPVFSRYTELDKTWSFFTTADFKYHTSNCEPPVDIKKYRILYDRTNYSI